MVSYDGHNFSSITITFIFRRKSLYFGLYFIFPELLLTVLQTLSHTLPVEHPGRMTMLTALFIGSSVTHSGVGAHIPKSSDTISLLQIYMVIVSINLVCSLIISFVMLYTVLRYPNVEPSFKSMMIAFFSVIWPSEIISFSPNQQQEKALPMINSNNDSYSANTIESSASLETGKPANSTPGLQLPQYVRPRSPSSDGTASGADQKAKRSHKQVLPNSSKAYCDTENSSWHFHHHNNHNNPSSSNSKNVRQGNHKNEFMFTVRLNDKQTPPPINLEAVIAGGYIPHQQPGNRHGLVLPLYAVEHSAYSTPQHSSHGGTLLSSPCCNGPVSRHHSIGYATSPTGNDNVADMHWDPSGCCSGPSTMPHQYSHNKQPLRCPANQALSHQHSTPIARSISPAANGCKVARAVSPSVPSPNEEQLNDDDKVDSTNNYAVSVPSETHLRVSRRRQASSFAHRQSGRPAAITIGESVELQQPILAESVTANATITKSKHSQKSVDFSDINNKGNNNGNKPHIRKRASTASSSLLVDDEDIKKRWLVYCVALDKVIMYVAGMFNLLVPIILFAMVPMVNELFFVAQGTSFRPYNAPV